MHKNHLFLPCVILLASLAVACADPVEPAPTPECSTETWQITCTNGTEKRCVDGKLTDHKCDNNQVCVNNRCGTEEPKEEPQCNPNSFSQTCKDGVETTCEAGKLATKKCKDMERCYQNACTPYECDPNTYQRQCNEAQTATRSCENWVLVFETCEPYEICKNGLCTNYVGSTCTPETFSPHCESETTNIVCNRGIVTREECAQSVENGVCKDGVCVNSSPTIDDPITPQPDIELVDGVWVLPLTAKPFTTLQHTFKPYATELAIEYIKSYKFNVTQYELFDHYGMGLEDAPGEEWQVKQKLLSPDSPSHTFKGKSIAYIWQTSDAQIIDEESPVRMEGLFMYPFSLASAYKPQSNLVAQIFATQVGNARRISELSTRPFDFVLATGDFTDNAQFNEFNWFLTALNGGLVNPDSGNDDDPVPGANNDASDPFYSKGLGDIPWYPAIGNHDMLYLGFTSQTEEVTKAVVSDTITNLYNVITNFFGCTDSGCGIGYRDASKPTAPPVTTGTLPADENRRMLSKAEALEMLYNAQGLPEHHGLNRETLDAGWGYYSTYPIEGKPVRLISLDTNSGVSSEGAMYQQQFDWLSEQISDAKDKNELVIISSHHCTEGLDGDISEQKLHNLLASYQGVVLHVCGHGHTHISWARKSSESSTGGYWEIMSSSTVDFPSQTRVIEVVHEGNGVISIYVTNLDTNAPKGSLVRNAVSWAAARTYFASLTGNPAEKWENDKIHRNMILRTNIPEAVWKNLDNYEWSSTIESVQTLKNFTYQE